MTTVVTQPQPGTDAAVASDWQSGVFGCFEDTGVCVRGTFCYLCLGCQVAKDMNEFCLCGSSVALRTLYRTKYGIPGSILSDFLWLSCFSPCALCQLKRDINKRKSTNTF
ncbi:placenta-specific gene 8 protein-like [Ornithorhynchus anatinus]|nr:placenta-specific gene 8 protein-like [Ornithorhynchus anatinus]XP_028930142.1 placenta-specific gene 8 protein-like [Ornithorhynchus anatinus]XP_028930144.1 placenta-specific gene 8 protein-like [Ornithorhynchus anatinus]XP_028930145.1 placenta-specific gene 8 protein-like [Ornithorhynchus anatinus]